MPRVKLKLTTMQNQTGTRLHFSIMLPLFIVLGLLSTGQALYKISATINGQIYNTPGGHVGELTPKDWDLPYQDVQFETSDGSIIEGWFVDKEDSTRAVIFAPGRGANRWDILENAPVRYLYENDFDILLFDPRNTGLSEGDRYGFGYFESQDIIHACKFLREEKGVTAIGVWGGSAGASAAIIAGLESSIVDAIIADSPYASLKMAASSYGRHKDDKLLQIFFPFYMGVARFTLNFDIYGKTDLFNRVKNLKTPLFLIHGLEDQALEPLNSQLLYERAGGPRRLWLAEGAWHVGTHEVYPVEYRKRVTAFFNSYLGQSITG